MALKLMTFDISDQLDSEEAIAEYISQVMAEGDNDELLRALGHVAKARGMAQIAEKTGLGRESLYKALRPGASPGFATVGKVMGALGFTMAVRPTAKPKPAAAVIKKAVKKVAKAKKGTGYEHKKIGKAVQASPLQPTKMRA